LGISLPACYYECFSFDLMKTTGQRRVNVGGHMRRQSEMIRAVARLSTGVPQGSRALFQPGGDMAGLFGGPRELRLVNVQFLRKLLLAEAMFGGR